MENAIESLQKEVILIENQQQQTQAQITKDKQINHTNRYINQVITIMEQTFNNQDQIETFVEKAQLQKFDSNDDFDWKYQALLSKIVDTQKQWTQQIDQIQVPKIVNYQSENKVAPQVDEYNEQELSQIIISLNKCENQFINVNQQYQHTYDQLKEELLQVIKYFNDFKNFEQEKQIQQNNLNTRLDLHKKCQSLINQKAQLISKLQNQLNYQLSNNQQKQQHQYSKDKQILIQKQQKVKQLIIKIDYYKKVLKLKENQKFVILKTKFEKKYQQFIDYNQVMIQKCKNIQKQCKQQYQSLRQYQQKYKNLLQYRIKKIQLQEQLDNQQRMKKFITNVTKVQKRYKNLQQLKQNQKNKFQLCQQRYIQILLKQRDRILKSNQQMLKQYKLLRQKQTIKILLQNQIYQLKKMQKTQTLKIFNAAMLKYTEKLYYYVEQCTLLQQYITDFKFTKLNVIKEEIIKLQATELLKQLQVLVNTWKQNLDLKQFKIYQLNQEYDEQQILDLIERLETQNNQILDQGNNIQQNITNIITTHQKTTSIDNKLYNYQQIQVLAMSISEQTNNTNTIHSLNKSSPYQNLVKLKNNKSPKMILQKMEVQQKVDNINKKMEKYNKSPKQLVNQKTD